MLNQYPVWKYILVIGVVLFGLLYAIPNLYEPQPAVQIASSRAMPINQTFLDEVTKSLAEQNVTVVASERTADRILLRFDQVEHQLLAANVLKEAYQGDYIIALTNATTVPGWMRNMNAIPMYLGLDLRGGVHFLMEVDMDAAVRQAQERYKSDIRGLLRKEKIRYLGVTIQGGGVLVKFRSEADRLQAQELIHEEYRTLELTERDGEHFPLLANIAEEEQREIKKFAVDQNITTLRNRVNELGVAEPIIQRQGDRRIIVQLPGVNDPSEAVEILGATATLEYRAVDIEGSVQDALAGKAPPTSKLYYERDGNPVLLKKQVIVTGDQIIDARSGFDEGNLPAVIVRLDGKGAKKMSDFTKESVGKPMAVVYKENKTVYKIVDGEKVRSKQKIEEVISVATIREHFSARFQTTGLDSPSEARNLALLLRAGALAAPIDIIEERTIGPSLGKDNIEQGRNAVIFGFILVVIFMALYYRTFGLVADLALILNLVLIVAVLSLLQATLTLPGIAGIVLTVGMAVDANVLIFERIREEIRNGNSPQASIHAGYEKALSTIADANITTLIAAIVLFAFGTGPIKGFAVTLSIGIVTSMFTAIMGTRAVINLIYGGKRVKKLAI